MLGQAQERLVEISRQRPWQDGGLGSTVSCALVLGSRDEFFRPSRIVGKLSREGEEKKEQKIFVRYVCIYTRFPHTHTQGPTDESPNYRSRIT